MILYYRYKKSENYGKWLSNRNRFSDGANGDDKSGISIFDVLENADKNCGK